MEDKRNELKTSEAKENKPAAGSGYRAIKKRNKGVMMPEAKYDGAFDKENEYYIKIANKYGILKYITVLLAVGFALLMLTVYSGDITSENFQYLLKDLDITGIGSGGTFETVIYNGGTGTSFTIYRGELAVVNSGSTMLYKPSGAVSFSKTNKFYNPRLLTSDKYLLVYDRGETTNSYTIYNSFAELHVGKYEYPITIAALSDNGAYAIVTRDETYRSVVYVYDSNFKLRNEIKLEKYVTSLSLTDDGSKVAITSVYDKNGGYETEILVLGINAQTPDYTAREEGRLCLSSRWLDNGNLMVMYSDGVNVYSPEGETASTLEMTGLLSHKYALGDTLMVSAYNNTVLGYDKTVNVYNENAEQIFSTTMDGELLKILPHGTRVCLLFEDRVVMIDTEDGSMYSGRIEPNAKDILLYEGTVIVCYSGSARPVALEKIK